MLPGSTTSFSQEWSADAGGAILRAAFWGGLFDLAFSCLLWQGRGIGPQRILQGIAAGALGRAAFAGGWRSAALGLFLFAFICVAAAAVYFLACERFTSLATRPVSHGLLYGAVVNVVLYDVVRRLSAAPPSAPSLPMRLAALAGCAVCFGLPVALAARRRLADRFEHPSLLFPSRH